MNHLILIKEVITDKFKELGINHLDAGSASGIKSLRTYIWQSGDCNKTISDDRAKALADYLKVQISDITVEYTNQKNKGRPRTKPLASKNLAYFSTKTTKDSKPHKSKNDFTSNWKSLSKREVPSNHLYSVDRLGMRRKVAELNKSGVVVYLNEYISCSGLESLVQGIRNKNVE